MKSEAVLGYFFIVIYTQNIPVARHIPKEYLTSGEMARINGSSSIPNLT
jgi:hypothetical protein